MGFVNKTYQQLVELFSSMTPAARLMAILLAAAVGVSLFFLFQLQVETPDDYLLGGRPFTAGELTSVQRALSDAGLNKWELEGSRIKIPGGQKHLYIAALSEGNALPADFASYFEKAVHGNNPFMSKHEIDLRMRSAKQQELALVISRFQNVEQASVIFDEVEKDGLRRTKLKTASVAVQTNGAGLEEVQVKAIRNLLGASYAGLDRGSITITDTTTGASYDQPRENGGGSEGLYAANKVKFEADWRKKIQERLSYISGAIVGVNVELHPEVQSETTSVKIDPKVVPLKTSENSVETTSTGADTSGRPGAVPNGVGQVGNQPAQVSAAAVPKSQSTESKSEQQSVAGHEHKTQRLAGLTPERVTASIGVPASYMLKVWRQANPIAPGEKEKTPDANELKRIETQEVERIKESVVNLLPPVALGKEPYPLVTVTTFTDIPGKPIPATPFMATATDWLNSNWRTVAMFVLGLVGLFMLRGMLNAAAPPLPVAKAEASEPAADAHGHGQGHGQAAAETKNSEAEEDEDAPEPILKMKRRLSTRGPNLREELRQLVKDDPDAAANVIRGWIGDAA
jgi:flagellar M-ring protein FliF